MCLACQRHCPPSLPRSQGLGILARRQQPQHVLAFLQALLPIASAAGGVARQALGEMRQVADAVQERWDARQRELEEQEQAAVAAAGGSAAATTQEEVRRAHGLAWPLPLLAARLGARANRF